MIPKEQMLWQLAMARVAFGLPIIWGKTFINLNGCQRTAGQLKSRPATATTPPRHRSPRHRPATAPPHEKKLLRGDFFPKFFKRQG
jgi:hypothetical protein